MFHFCTHVYQRACFEHGVWLCTCRCGIVMGHNVGKCHNDKPCGARYLQHVWHGGTSSCQLLLGCCATLERLCWSQHHPHSGTADSYSLLSGTASVVLVCCSICKTPQNKLGCNPSTQTSKPIIEDNYIYTGGYTLKTAILQQERLSDVFCCLHEIGTSSTE